MNDQIVNIAYNQLATETQIERVAQALETNNIHTIVVETGKDACDTVLSLLPEGAEVHSAASRTLDQIGLTEAIEKSGCYRAIRPQLRRLDRLTQAQEIRKLASAPEYMLGSVQAVTESGQVVIGSGSGSQIGPYASGAGKVIWIVGAQKLVPTLEDALDRLHYHSLPLENERMQTTIGRPAHLNQILIIQGALFPGRFTMVIVKENLGF
jgi:L-lactate utilization protein LutC